MAKKAGIYCGHGESTDGSWDPGTTFKGTSEAALMLPITKAAVKYCKYSGITVYTDANEDNDINMIKQVEEANGKKTDIFVSVHCDWYKATSGTRPLYVSERGKELAETINRHVTTDMKMRTHGVQKRADLYELYATDMPACIFETGSIDDDSDKFKDYDKYGKAIAKGICEYLGVSFKEHSTSTATEKHRYGGTFPTLPWHGVYRYFRYGDRGTQVKNLQRLLNWAVGSDLNVDGIIGTETVGATEKFQREYDLTVDGEFGKNSLAKAKTIKK